MEDTKFKMLKLLGYVFLTILEIAFFFIIFGIMWLINLLFKVDINIWLVTLIVYTIIITRNYIRIIVNLVLEEIKNNENL
ncbi:MAG: hypothetical protein E7G37_01625 [Streptococcus sp.]|nr:hypothetical protein [Streptococcus sp.]